VEVGDLVLAEMHTNEKFLGIIIEVNSSPLVQDPIDLMFPYHITFFTTLPDDWYRGQDLEVISESR
jgi:hypothetical protein